MIVVLIGAAACLGGIVTALLGWTETQEAFDAKKFISSVIRALIGGVGIAAAFNYAGDITAISFLLAFLAGAGVDAGGKRISGAIKAGLK